MCHSDLSHQARTPLLTKGPFVILFLIILSASYTFYLHAQTGSSKKNLPLIQGGAKGTMGHLTVRELTNQAEIIVRGKIVSVQSVWNREKTRIFTKASLSAGEYIKGNPGGNTLTITYPGGEVGTEGELYSGAVSFKNDEEVLVFIKKDRENNFIVSGGAEGKYLITTDKKTGKKMVAPAKTLENFTVEIQGYIKGQTSK